MSTLFSYPNWRRNSLSILNSHLMVSSGFQDWVADRSSVPLISQRKDQRRNRSFWGRSHLPGSQLQRSFSQTQRSFSQQMLPLRELNIIIIRRKQPNGRAVWEHEYCAGSVQKLQMREKTVNRKKFCAEEESLDKSQVKLNYTHIRKFKQEYQCLSRFLSTLNQNLILCHIMFLKPLPKPLLRPHHPLHHLISTSSKLLFFGSDDVAFPSLQSLHSTFKNLQVITHFSKPNIKIQNKVQTYCKNNNIECLSPIHKVEKEERKRQWKAFEDGIRERPVLGVVISYGYMIPNSVIDVFEKGMIVVHPSLLPKYRGGAPIFHAIANGDEVSGVSYIDISKRKFDQGNILHQVETPIPTDKPYKDIEQILAQLAAKHLPEVVLNMEKLRPGKPQTDQKHSSAPIIKDTKLDLNRPAIQVYNWSRALKMPRVTINKLDIIIRLGKETLEGEGEVGQLRIQGKKNVYVRCKDKYVKILAYKEPSKGQLKASAFFDKFIKSREAIEANPTMYKLS